MKKSTKQVTVIGFFVIGALALFLGLLLTMGGNKWAQETLHYRIFYPTSVKGLSVGAPVMFRGISIGEVDEIKLAPQDATLGIDESRLADDIFPVEVGIKIFPERLGYHSRTVLKFLRQDHETIQKAHAFLGELVLKKRLRAKLETLSILTGQIYISLEFVAEKFDDEEEKAEFLWSRNIIPIQYSLFDRISDRMASDDACDRLENLQKLIRQISDFIENGGTEKLFQNISNTSQNINETTQTIRNELPQVLQQIKQLSERSNNAITRLDELLGVVQGEVPGAVADARKLMGDADGLLVSCQGELPGAVADARKLMGDADGLLTDIRPEAKQLIENINATLKTTQDEMVRLQALTDSLLKGTAEDSPERQRIQDVLQECDQLIMQLRTLTETLNRNPQALLLGE